MGNNTYQVNISDIGPEIYVERYQYKYLGEKNSFLIRLATDSFLEKKYTETKMVPVLSPYQNTTPRKTMFPFTAKPSYQLVTTEAPTVEYWLSDDQE